MQPQRLRTLFGPDWFIFGLVRSPKALNGLERTKTSENGPFSPDNQIYMPNRLKQKPDMLGNIPVQHVRTLFGPHWPIFGPWRPPEAPKRPKHAQNAQILRIWVAKTNLKDDLDQTKCASAVKGICTTCAGLILSKSAIKWVLEVQAG